VPAGCGEYIDADRTRECFRSDLSQKVQRISGGLVFDTVYSHLIEGKRGSTANGAAGEGQIRSKPDADARSKRLRADTRRKMSIEVEPSIGQMNFWRLKVYVATSLV